MPFFSRDAIPHHLVESPPEKMHAHPRSLFQLVSNFSRLSGLPTHGARTLQRAVEDVTSFRQTKIQLLCQIDDFRKKLESQKLIKYGSRFIPACVSNIVKFFAVERHPTDERAAVPFRISSSTAWKNTLKSLPNFRTKLIMMAEPRKSIKYTNIFSGDPSRG
jgi:hypothetical protein